jgi:hypothetical protein
MKNTILHTIYDLLTGQEIIFYEGKFKNFCHNFGFNYTQVCHLSSGRNFSINDRYILPKNKNRIFILVDFETQKEYECVNNRTIFLHLNIPYTENEGKYVYELKKQRQKHATIGKHLFYLKNNSLDSAFGKTLSKIKATGVEIEKLRTLHKLKMQIVKRLRTSLCDAIRNYRAKKSDATHKLLGCSFEYFFKYLEGKFEAGMHWGNHGRSTKGIKRWQIDHIKPISAFNILDPDEQKKCFHYSNLQPLWWEENIKKGSNYLT